MPIPSKRVKQLRVTDHEQKFPMINSVKIAFEWSLLTAYIDCTNRALIEATLFVSHRMYKNARLATTMRNGESRVCIKCEKHHFARCMR
jgi:hypothetical protein